MSNKAVQTFHKGLQTDSSVVNQPESTYRDALNVTLLNDKGEYHVISNEKGTVQYVSIPNSYNVIGHTIVDDSIVLCLVDTANSYSQIGVIRDGVYTQKVPAAGEDNELNFSINNPVDIKGKKLFNGDTSIYFTDNNEPIASINLDDLPTSISKTKNIVPDIDLPTITYNSIIKGGKLDGGVYQFAIRYLNKELVPTVSTLPTNPIPIIASPEGSPLNSVEGANYDKGVNKAIKLDITNIDTDYPFFELIVIGYEGATSAPTAYITDTYNITSDTKSIIFSGIDDDSVLTTPDEVLAEPITYSRAKAVEQKDGRLFFSNLTEGTSRFAEELQEVANAIQVRYATDVQNEEYYADPINSADNKTYRKGEVYSLGIGVKFKNGSSSYVYHIPAPIAAGTPGTITNPADTGTKVLGTYLSSDEYPVGVGYPTGNIRHHVMPTIYQEPVYAGTQVDFNLLYIVFDNINLSQELKDNIQEIVFYREPRDSREKRSKLSQGFATNVFLGATDYESQAENSAVKRAGYSSDTVRRGDADPSSFHFRKNFGFFNMQLNTYYNIDRYLTMVTDNHKTYLEGNKKQWSTHNGCYYSASTLEETIYDKRASGSPSSPLSQSDEQRYQYPAFPMEANKLCFMSPETLLADGVFLNADFLRGATLKRSLEFSTTSLIQKTETVFDNKTMAFTAVYLKKISFPAYTGNFNVSYVLNPPISTYNTGSLIKDSVYVNNGDKVKLSSLPNFDFDNTYSGKFLYLELEDLFTQNTLSVGNMVSMGFPLSTTSNTAESFRVYGGLGVEGSGIGTPDVMSDNLDMYEIENPLNNQYGNIESSLYAPIYSTKDLNITTTPNLLGGDTFVTRYTINHKTLINRYFPFFKSVSYTTIPGFPTSDSYKFFAEAWQDSEGNRAFVTTSVNKNTYTPEVIPGYCFNSAVTYLVESDINCYYRFLGDNGVPYFPISDVQEVGNALPNQEENRNYNTQYSKDNTINTNLVSRPIFDEAITSYPNRTIYSDRANEDSKVDNYQIFKQESEYDLPEETGEIIDTFVYNNEFYSHTPKALWRNFVNTTTKEASTIGEVVLGTGGLFSLPSQKVLTAEGGYGGTITQFGNAVTPFGYFFVDLLQRKVFQLTDNLEEVSLHGMQEYFDNNLIVPTDREDNTFKFNSPKNISMGWDNEYKRILLTQHDDDNSFTISYSPVTKAWLSFHSYIPSTYVTDDKFVHSIINTNVGSGDLYQHNVGDYGVYHGNSIQPMMIDIVSNKSPIDEKVFDNYYVHSRSYERNGDFVNLDFFNTLECRNDYQDSGLLNISTTNAFDPVVANNEVLNRWKKSHFQLYLPRNNHEANLDNPGDWTQASRLKSKYLKTRFTYNNLDNREFVVNFIEYFFRPIAR